ncbi:Rhomboid protease GlpG [Rubripirellula tenax]|uniref:Rhomboid protease GlpG n=1 Tax=Rubripirellula tenax TaxID=2528015 RepID=A0A5C6EQ87_9BACT|nr:rhomboid family intramembrane serine protease [Rubripirellula tenax]TWU51078.1 Rhomboid protease GlpG [Rubripirellula tenax]
MRRIGSFTNESTVRQFVEYLYTRSIDAKIIDSGAEGDERKWDLWIRDEADLESARAALADFETDPNAERFKSSDLAEQMRDERIDRERARFAAERDEVVRETSPYPKPAKPTQPPQRGESDESLLADVARQQSIPITIAIIAISVIVSFTTNFGKPRGSARRGEVTLEQRVYSELSFVDRDEFAKSGRNPFASIEQGQVWRLFTPLLLHGDEFHLAFNMLWIFFLGSAIERLHGSIFFAVLIIVTQTAGMMLQVAIPPLDWIPATLHGSPFAIGASGAVYGLFGFLWIRPLLDDSYPINLDPMNVVLMLGWLIACMIPLIPGVANGAHLGGLIGGVVAAVLSYGVMGRFAKR